MKVIMYAAVILSILSICALVFISVVPSSAENQEASDRFRGTNGATVITDNKTGCKYLLATNENGTGLSPLYDAKGKLHCGK